MPSSKCVVCLEDVDNNDMHFCKTCLKGTCTNCTTQFKLIARCTSSTCTCLEYKCPHCRQEVTNHEIYASLTSKKFLELVRDNAKAANYFFQENVDLKEENESLKSKIDIQEKYITLLEEKIKGYADKQ